MLSIRSPNGVASVALLFVLVVPVLVPVPGHAGDDWIPALEDGPAAAVTALDELLECERPDGGWMYPCQEGDRVFGATSVIRVTGRISRFFGFEPWELIVLRSPGTSAAGLVLIDGHRRFGHERFLRSAVRAGDLLVELQLPNGGWFSEMPAHGGKLAWWFKLIAPWATLDDDTTTGAIRFLLELWIETNDERYRRSAERGIDLLLATQLPSGAWPLTYRPPLRRMARWNFEDQASLNDGATSLVIVTLLRAAELLERPDLQAAAERGGRWILAIRGDRPAWAQQYDANQEPTTARTFEPVALAVWETRHALDALERLAERTGDQSFCEPFAEVVDWFARTTFAESCWARFYELDAPHPIFLDRDGNRVRSRHEAKRPYRWIGTYGVPGLLASLGLAPDGYPLEETTRIAPRRIPGDAGACPIDRRRRSVKRRMSEFARLRIGYAANVLTATSEPSQGACRVERELLP